LKRNPKIYRYGKFLCLKLIAALFKITARIYVSTVGGKGNSCHTGAICKGALEKVRIVPNKLKFDQ